jgi:hypothetical protein
VRQSTSGPCHKKGIKPVPFDLANFVYFTFTFTFTLTVTFTVTVTLTLTFKIRTTVVDFSQLAFCPPRVRGEGGTRPLRGDQFHLPRLVQFHRYSIASRSRL